MSLRQDSETRRGRIAEAVLAIAARDGLDAASVRDVAAEANVSAGMVQHYFRTRDEILRFACEYLVERNSRRIHERVQALPDPTATRSVLRATFEVMLPLDAARRDEVRIWIAFLARAVVRPDLEAFMRQTHVETHQYIAARLSDGQAKGTIRGDVDPHRATVALFAMVEGLVSHVLLGHYSGDEALRAIDDQLDTLTQS